MRCAAINIFTDQALQTPCKTKTTLSSQEFQAALSDALTASLNKHANHPNSPAKKNKKTKNGRRRTSRNHHADDDDDISMYVDGYDDEVTSSTNEVCTEGNDSEGESRADDHAQRTVEVLWGGRLEKILASNLQVGDIIFVASGWAPPATCRVLACSKKHHKSWPIPHWAAADDTAVAESVAPQHGSPRVTASHWTFSRTMNMDTVQARRDDSGGVQHIVLSNAPASSPTATRHTSENIAVANCPIMRGAMLGVVLELASSDRPSEPSGGGVRINTSATDSDDSFSFDVADQDLERMSHIANLLRAQDVVDFGRHSSTWCGRLYAEHALAKLRAAIVGDLPSVSASRGKRRKSSGSGDMSVTMWKTLVVISLVPPFDPEEVNCMRQLMAEMDVFVIFLLAPGVSTSIAKGIHVKSSTDIPHIASSKDAESFAALVHKAANEVGGAPENSGAAAMSATIDPRMLEFLMSSLQAPLVETPLVETHHHALALSSPSTRASPAENGHGLSVVRRYRVIYVGGVLCRAFPGVHHVDDMIQEDSDACSSNSISHSEAKAMSLSFLSIALFGCTDNARDVADIVITADEDEDSLYANYDRISPVLYLFANVIDYSGDSVTASNRSSGCFSCG